MEHSVWIESAMCSANRVGASCAASLGLHAWACPSAPSGLVAFGSGSQIALVAPHASAVVGILQGHTGRVSQVAWVVRLEAAATTFADETELVSGAADHSVRVWSIAHARSSALRAGHCEAVLLGHTGPVSAVAALGLPDGAAFAASVSADCTLRLWHRPAEAAPGAWGATAVHRVRPSGIFEAVALTVAPGWKGAEGGLAASGASDDLAARGLVIAAAGVDCQVHLFGVFGKVETAVVELLLSVAGHADWVRHVAFPAPFAVGWEGGHTTFLASASNDGKVRLWRLQAQRPESVELSTAVSVDRVKTLDETAAETDDFDGTQSSQLRTAPPPPLLASGRGDGAAVLHSITLAGLERPRVLKLPLFRGAGYTASAVCYEVFADALLTGHSGWVTSVAWQAPLVVADSSGAPSLWQPPRLVSASVNKAVIAWAPVAGPSSMRQAPHTAGGSGPPSRVDLWRGVWEPASRTGGAGGSSLGLLGAVVCADGVTLVAHSLQGALHAWTARHFVSPPLTSSPKRSRTCPASAALLEGPATLSQLAGWGAIPMPTGHFGPINDVAWSADGGYFFSAADDATTRAWASRPTTAESPPATLAGLQNRWYEVGRPQIHGYPMVALTTAAVPGVPHRLLSAGDEKVIRAFDAPLLFLATLSRTSHQVAAAATASPPLDVVKRVAFAYVPELGLTNKGVETLGAAGVAAAIPDALQLDGRDAVQEGFDARGRLARSAVRDSDDGCVPASTDDPAPEEREYDASQDAALSGGKHHSRRPRHQQQVARQPPGLCAEGGSGRGALEGNVSCVGSVSDSVFATPGTAEPADSLISSASTAACIGTGAPELSPPPLEEDLVLRSRWPEVGRLFGHQHEVLCIAVSACGRVVATAAKARDALSSSIRLWNALTFEPHQVLAGLHQLSVATLAFSPTLSDELSGANPNDDHWLQRRACGGCGSRTSAYLISAGKDRTIGVYARCSNSDGCSKPGSGNATLDASSVDVAALPLEAFAPLPEYAPVCAVAAAHKRIIWSLAWAPDSCVRLGDGERGAAAATAGVLVFASGARDHAVKLWTVPRDPTPERSNSGPSDTSAAATCAATLPEFPSAVTTVAWAPAVRRSSSAAAAVYYTLAVGEESGAVSLWLIRGGLVGQQTAWSASQTLREPVHVLAVRRIAWRPLLLPESSGRTEAPAADEGARLVGDSLCLHAVTCSADESLRVLRIAWAPRALEKH